VLQAAGTLIVGFTPEKYAAALHAPQR
jgi:hypothetical protein